MEGSNFCDRETLLRQLSVKNMSCSSAKRLSKKGKPVEAVEIKKRVMVVVDHSQTAKNAVMWALTHVANKEDLLTLLEVVSPHCRRQRKSLFTESSSNLASPQLTSLCKSYRPEVDIEALVIQGPKLDTVLNQVEKLEAAVLVLGQKKPSPLNCLIKSSNGEFVEQCINTAQCLTIAVRKPSTDLSGYLISTKWQKNFWLLA